VIRRVFGIIQHEDAKTQRRKEEENKFKTLRVCFTDLAFLFLFVLFALFESW